MKVEACECGSAIHLYGEVDAVVRDLWLALHVGSGHGRCTADEARHIRYGNRNLLPKVHMLGGEFGNGHRYPLCGGNGQHNMTVDPDDVTCFHCRAALDRETRQ